MHVYLSVTGINNLRIHLRENKFLFKRGANCAHCFTHRIIFSDTNQSAGESSKFVTDLQPRYRLELALIYCSCVLYLKKALAYIFSYNDVRTHVSIFTDNMYMNIRNYFPYSQIHFVARASLWMHVHMLSFTRSDTRWQNFRGAMRAIRYPLSRWANESSLRVFTGRIS